MTVLIIYVMYPVKFENCIHIMAKIRIDVTKWPLRVISQLWPIVNIAYNKLIETPDKWIKATMIKVTDDRAYFKVKTSHVVTEAEFNATMLVEINTCPESAANMNINYIMNSVNNFEFIIMSDELYVSSKLDITWMKIVIQGKSFAMFDNTGKDMNDIIIHDVIQDITGLPLNDYCAASPELLRFIAFKLLEAYKKRCLHDN